MGLVPIMRELDEEQINPVPKAELGGVIELAEAEVLRAVVDRERRIFDEALGPDRPSQARAAPRGARAPRRRGLSRQPGVTGRAPVAGARPA